MRGKTAGHEFTYCHHSMSEAAQQLGKFVVDNDIPTEAVVELMAGMVADSAFDWRKAFPREVENLKEPLEVFLDAFSEFREMLAAVEEKKVLPRDRAEWMEHLRQGVEQEAAKLKGWDPNCFRGRKRS
jgi:hypothetical protein